MCVVDLMSYFTVTVALLCEETKRKQNKGSGHSIHFQFQIRKITFLAGVGMPLEPVVQVIFIAMKSCK